MIKKPTPRGIINFMRTNGKWFWSWCLRNRGLTLHFGVSTHSNFDPYPYESLKPQYIPYISADAMIIMLMLGYDILYILYAYIYCGITRVQLNQWSNGCSPFNFVGCSLAAWHRPSNVAVSLHRAHFLLVNSSCRVVVKTGVLPNEGFHKWYKWGYPHSWMVFVMENPISRHGWWLGGSPILGNFQICICFCWIHSLVGASMMRSTKRRF